VISQVIIKRFPSFKVILSIFAWCLLFGLNLEGRTLSQEKAEGWVPDYNKRDKWQQPEKILDAIGIKSGMIIADVGSGTGYLTLRLANRVGDKGIVYASDIRKDRINKLKDRAQKAGFNNIITLHGTEKDPGLPKGKFDMVIMLHVIHIVIKNQDPQALLANIKPALKPGGTLVLVHWDGKKMGYPEVEAYSKESVLKVMKEAGFKLTRLETFLPRDNIFILKAD
jgi:ubiquinone/menaquinone biosynthesis C-methylase UbiE